MNILVEILLGLIYAFVFILGFLVIVWSTARKLWLWQLATFCGTVVMCIAVFGVVALFVLAP